MFFFQKQERFYREGGDEAGPPAGGLAIQARILQTLKENGDVDGVLCSCSGSRRRCAASLGTRSASRSRWVTKL